jgi:hypothetical protein
MGLDLAIPARRQLTGALHLDDTQDLVRSSIVDQEAATKVGLRYLQVGTNKTALDVLISERASEQEEAMKRFEIGMSTVGCACTGELITSSAQQAYVEAKADTKTKLDASKYKLDSVDDDVRESFKEMEEAGTVTERDADELQNELELQRQRLELCFQTNPGVVEQYERRKAEVSSLCICLRISY